MKAIGQETIGKPDAVNPPVRFDEGGGFGPPLLYCFMSEEINRIGRIASGRINFPHKALKTSILIKKWVRIRSKPRGSTIVKLAVFT
jgi:hypothetical protein